MNRKFTLIGSFQLSGILVAAFLILINADLQGQNSNANKEISIAIACVEYDGDGQLIAYFSYDNPSNKTIVIDEQGSVVTYNHGQAIKAGIYVFEPGVKEKAFSQEFDATDEVEWTVTFPDGSEQTVTADISYNHCTEDGLPIEPGYYPPEGGKEYNSKIGAENTSLWEFFMADPSGFTGASDNIFQIRGTRVLNEAVSFPGTYAAMLYSLDSLGVELVTSNPGLRRATFWIEIPDLNAMNFISALYWARNVFPGVANYTVPPTGVTKSQGDFAMHSDFARLGYDIDGSGVKIGVLSNSYNTQGTAHTDVSNGDLPGPGNPNGYTVPVDVLQDMVLTSGSLSDEGRAMLQIVHDIAPGAELAFRTGFLGEQDMALAIRELANAGSDIIVDDLSYITEPFFRDGVISQTIDSVVSEGVSFFSSAGNFGRTAYTAVYNPTTGPATISGTVHNFDGLGDAFQNVLLLEGDYTLVLQWDDDSDPTMSTTATDLDIFLSDDVGFSLLGFNRENIGGFPIEVVPFSVLQDSVYVNIVIAREAGPEVPVTLKYMLFRGGSNFKMQEYDNQGVSTIVGHPNAAGAISVGAVRFDKNPLWDPITYPDPVIMSFSSEGGTPVNGIVRDKPDITAPNGVNTTIDLGNGDWVTDPPEYTTNIDPDTLFPNFFGTSAASPHAAGVAALIKEAKAKFDSISFVAPDTIRSLLKNTALEMNDPDLGDAYNYSAGSGFIQAHRALMTFASPTPYVENLILISDGGVPGEEITPLSFTINGDFFTDSTQVYFRGEPLDTGVVVVDENTITVNHEGFLGNPELQVYNPVLSSSELDGGFSESVYFTNPVRQRVVITANNVNKKFGEVMPDYSASFMVVTVDDDTLSFEEAVTNSIMTQEEADRLSTLSYSTPATDTSIAGGYIIQPSLDPVLDVENPITELDHAITEKFILELVNGTLTIEKLDLKITPVDTSIVYGETLPEGGFQYLFEFGDSSVVITNPDSILLSVQQEYTSALSNEIGLVRGVALVNGIPVVRGTSLVNGTTLLRGVALVNGIEVKVEVVNSDTTVYVAGEQLVNGGTLVRGVALVNDRPFVSMTEILRGVALVNGDQVTFDNGYMTELNGVPLPNAISAVRGTALVNGLTNFRGTALVNGHTVVVENGVTTIDGVAVPNAGIVEVSGIPVIRGTALVNTSTISRGIALVNDLEVVIENGSPTGRGIALVNGSATLRGIALVNGIPLYRGTALVNNLEVTVNDGEVSQVYENGVLVNGLTLSRGLALVNDVPLVNGGELLSRGTALVNGILVPDADGNGDGEDVVNLENMNFLASGAALANGLNSLRGVALVNGIESEDGQALKLAAGTVQDDGSIVYESSITSRGLALVNGLNYVRGTALVNGSPLDLRGTALVNGSTVNENSNTASILVFDATEIGDTTENVGFTPTSFITGTTVGQQKIVPGTYVSSNKYNITYGLGTLTIEPTELVITADDKSKIYGEEDPDLTYTDVGLLGEDTIAGELIREVGEDVGDYNILQGSVNAGYNYTILFDTATFSIGQRLLEIEITAADKVYDGTPAAVTTAFVEYGLVEGDEVTVASENGQFESKHAGLDKLVTADVSLTGADASNYLANVSADTTADITALSLNVTAVTDTKTYDGTNVSAGVPLMDPVADGDAITSSPVQVFDTKHAGSGKTLSASGLVIDDGNGGNNYSVSYTDVHTGVINALPINVTAVTDSREYDGTNSSDGTPLVDPLMATDAVSTDPVQVFENMNAGTGKTLMAGGLEIDDGNSGANYLVSYVDDYTGEITPRPVTVTPTDPILYIWEGDPLPVVAFIYNGWISGDTGNEGYTVLRDTDGVAYDPSSKESAGIYTVTAAPSNSNYQYALESGVLYVNPGDNNTKAVKPVLNCIQEISDNYYMANFEYKNDNSDAIYVPLGPDNMLTGSGIDWGSSDAVPTLFVPGGGSFRVFFDGTDISWEVSTLDKNQKVRNGANANSSSTKCTGNPKSASVSGESILNDLDPETLKVYPNPVVDKVHISMKDIENYKIIQLFDLAGRSYPITSIDKRTDKLEIDMADLPSGHFIISIVMEDTTRVVQVIKK